MKKLSNTSLSDGYLLLSLHLLLHEKNQQERKIFQKLFPKIEISPIIIVSLSGLPEMPCWNIQKYFEAEKNHDFRLLAGSANSVV